GRVEPYEGPAEEGVLFPLDLDAEARLRLDPADEQVARARREDGRAGGHAAGAVGPRDLPVERDRGELPYGSELGKVEAVVRAPEEGARDGEVEPEIGDGAAGRQRPLERRAEDVERVRLVLPAGRAGRRHRRMERPRGRDDD